MKILTEEDSLDEWMKAAYIIADEHYDGCITVISSIKENKFSFSSVTSNEHIEELESYADLKDAIINAIQEHFTRMKLLDDELKSIL